MADEDNAPEEGAEGAAPEEAPKGGGIKRLIPIIVLLLVFLGGQFAIGMWVVGKLQPEDPKLKALEEEKRLEEEAKKELTKMGMTLSEPIEVTVNIAETNGERFLVCGLNFEWDALKYPMLQAELDLRKPKIKDIIYDVLRTKSLVELQAKEGKRNITDAVCADVNMTLPEEIGELRNCLIDKFIIQ